MKEYQTHKRAERFRRAIAQRIAQRVQVTDEMLQVVTDYEKAVSDYRNKVNEVADGLLPF